MVAKFDWIGFFKRHNINYVTGGPNFSRKMRANIRCPFCGDADPSEHLGVSAAGWWGCLRNAAHRGKSPHFLIQKLLGCSSEEARRIVGVKEESAPTRDDLAESFAALKRAVGGVPTKSRPKKLEFPSEFKPLLNGSPFAEPFLEYLEERGFRGPQITWLAKNYDLHYARRGRYAYRLVVPVYDRYGRLLTWTARSIRQDATLRYDTLRSSGDPSDGRGPVALAPDKETVLGLPVLYAAQNPKVLVLVEGPFDALKITAFGRGLGVYAAALFGLNVSESQVAEILELSQRFERTYLLLDKGAELHKLRLASELPLATLGILSLGDTAEDPGAMSGGAVTTLALRLVTNC